MQHIEDVCKQITPLDMQAMEQARKRQEQLTKPVGSLGRLEEMAIRVAGITGQTKPTVIRKAVLIMAGDHGVAVEGVSAYPAAVTPQMVYNFLHGGAAINALARYAQADVVVVDIGVAAELQHPQLVSRKIAYGTTNMVEGAAMTEQQMLDAIQVGIDIVNEQVDQGLSMVATGDMGIGNTTAASAITAVLLGLSPSQTTGRGTGIDDEQLAHKVQIIEQAISKNAPNPQQPLDALMKVGGLEIAGLVGVILGAAVHRIPIVIDGFISGAAALVAVAYCPQVRDYLFAGHTSVERGHRLLLQHLKLEPILDLELRLGEGTGAVLAMGIIEAALHAHNEMLTFAEAGVSNREE